MSVKIVHSNHRIEITPVISRWIWPANVSTEEAERKNIAKSCNDMIEEIKRHIDDVDSVAMRYDTDRVCEHCGSVWTEDSQSYNGGCCDKDEAAEDARLAGAAK